MNGWIRADLHRTKSQLWICPHCNGAVYQAYKKTSGGKCEYKYCPHCRSEVITEGKKQPEN